MKFAKLFDRADILRCSHIATGHYARIERSGEKYLLKKALDPSKDQSYVLYAMTQAQLARTLFPLAQQPAPPGAGRAYCPALRTATAPPR